MRFWITVLPEMRLWQGINAARIMFKKCVFDEVGCAQGIEALREYKFEHNDALNVFKSVPIHNWASHAADAFRYSITAYNFIQNQQDKQPRDQNYIYFDDLVAHGVSE
jgi:phage terminase large subunit